MAQIKIIAVPPGYAPEWVRQAWVGVVLPTASQRDLIHVSRLALATSGPNANGHVVLVSAAIEALRVAGKSRAAEYWKNHLPPVQIVLQFGMQFCEEIHRGVPMPKGRARQI